MQQQLSKKYKINARAWYLPGYHRLGMNLYFFGFDHLLFHRIEFPFFG
jgi:hypothetical protein